MAKIPNWLLEAAEQHGDWIKRSQSSYKRIEKRTGLPREHVVALCQHVRGVQRGAEQAPIPPDIVKQPVDDSVDDSGVGLLFEGDYVYNEHDDVYLTFLAGLTKPLALPGQTHRDLIRAYSDFDGEPSTVNEISRTFGLPRQWVVKYLRAHGVTHDSEPFSAEEILDRDEDELVEDALAMRRQTLYKRLSKEKWSQTERDAKRWVRYEQETLSVLRAAIEAGPTEVPRLVLGGSQAPFSAVVSPSDYHWGMYAWEGETGQTYNLTEAKRRLETRTAVLLDRLTRFGSPERIYAVLGSDWFNVDGESHQTTRGTPQDQAATYAQMLTTGSEVARLWVDLLRQVAPVTLVIARGNHDRASSVALGLYLQAWFRDVDDVEVIDSVKDRVYLVYGKTLMGFTHPDGVKHKKLPGLMASEAASEWGRSEHRAWFTGHLEHEKVLDADGTQVYVVPSLCGPDRWQARMGYTGSRRALAGYVIDKREGVVAVLYAPLMPEK